MRRRLRLAVLGLLALLAVSAAVGIADPHRGLLADGAGDGGPYTVQPSISPSVILEHANLNSRQGVVTATERTYPEPEADAPTRVWVHRYDPVAKRYHGALFFDGDEGPTWGLSEVFVGEAVTASRLGDVPRPSVDAPVEDPGAIERTATYGAYDAGSEGLLHLEDPDELHVVNATRHRVVLAVPDAGSYADLHGMEESRVREGSRYRVVVKRTSGRLTRVVDHRRVRHDDGDTSETYSVWSFEYGGPGISRPGWVRRGPVELVFDAFTL